MIAKQAAKNLSPITHSPVHPSPKRKAAFTLAEVLITLGIIGVVAAITMPSLISKYQMKSFAVALKKQYSVLQNTINYLNLNDSIQNCYVYIGYDENQHANVYKSEISDCLLLSENLISTLKLTQINKYVTYPKKADIMAKGGKVKNLSVLYDNVVNNMIPYQVPDGGVVYLVSNKLSNVFIVDVNGKKGPNRWGYDVFLFDLEKVNNSAIKLGYRYFGMKEKDFIRKKF